MLRIVYHDFDQKVKDIIYDEMDLHHSYKKKTELFNNSKFFFFFSFFFWYNKESIINKSKKMLTYLFADFQNVENIKNNFPLSDEPDSVDAVCCFGWSLIFYCVDCSQLQLS